MTNARPKGRSIFTQKENSPFTYSKKRQNYFAIFLNLLIHSLKLCLDIPSTWQTSALFNPRPKSVKISISLGVKWVLDGHWIGSENSGSLKVFSLSDTES